MKINVVLADDHQIFRDGIKALLADDKTIEVLAEASGGDQLLSVLKSVLPEVLILDITLPDISGIELTKIISEKYPSVKILILSMHTEEDFIINSLKNGAKGYLPKDTTKGELLEAIHSISSGCEFIGKQITSTILKNYLRKNKKGASENKEDNQLTRREKDIIELIAKGLSTKEIASSLFISPKTVDCHKTHILQKLNLKNSIELIIYSIKNRIIDLDKI